MAVHRCPKHDVLFESDKPPTQDGHKKCPYCNPEDAKKEKAQSAGKD